MNIGALRHRITLLQPVEVEDAKKTGFTKTWDELAPWPVWAAQEPTGTRAAERLLGQQIVATSSVVWRLRYHRALGALSTPDQLTCRVQHNTTTYAITGVVDVDGRHIEHLLACQEVRS